jgi:hypothetical protein
MGDGGGAAGLPTAELLIWMPAGGFLTDRETDTGRGGAGCFDIMKTAAKRVRSSVV